MRNIYPFLACQNGKSDRFCWLLPEKPWILKNLFDQQVVYRLDKSLPVERLQKKMQEIPFVKWQKKELEEIVLYLQLGYSFRKGVIAGLGAGKTLYALVLQVLGEQLYICPKHLKSSVIDEAEKWNLPVPIITTPESCHKFGDVKWTSVILDESLSCKNPETKRFEKVKKIMSDVSIAIAMTGTPLSAKRLPDLRWILTVGDFVPQKEKYWKHRFGVNPHHKDMSKLGVHIPARDDGSVPMPLEVDSWDTQKCADFCSDYLKIVSIEEIMSEVPQKKNQIVELPRPRFYKQILQGLLTEKSSSKRINQARTTTSGFVYDDNQNVIWLSKQIPQKIQWLKDLISRESNEPIVVFSAWQGEIERLIQEFPHAAIVTQSRKEVKRFTSGEVTLLICSSNITEGMNLQRSRIAIFLSNSTSPVKREQAEGRLYRQGQTRSVVIYDLICKDTLDQKQLDLLQSYRNESEEFISKALQIELEKGMKRL
jgi:hypothetical protein